MLCVFYIYDHWLIAIFINTVVVWSVDTTDRKIQKKVT